MSETVYTDMQSGEELDRLVAEKVMGEKLPQVWADASVGPSHGDPGGYRTGVRPYSTDLVAAWEVVDKLFADGYAFNLELNRMAGAASGEYVVSATITRGHSHGYVGKGRSVPLAICRAALEIVTKAR